MAFRYKFSQQKWWTKPIALASTELQLSERIQYLIKKPNNDHRQSCKYDIIQGLKPIIIESLTRESSMKGEPKLSQCERKILVKEVCHNLQWKNYI